MVVETGAHGKALAQLGREPGIFWLWGNSTNHWATYALLLLLFMNVWRLGEIRVKESGVGQSESGDKGQKGVEKWDEGREHKRRRGRWRE